MEIDYEDGQLAIRRGGATSLIPLGAVSTWAELLGFTNAVDVIDAILHKDELKSSNPDAEIDPETGGSIWDEVIAVKKHLERVREDEAERAERAEEAQERFSEARSRRAHEEQREALRDLRTCGGSHGTREGRSTDMVRSELKRLTGKDCEDSETVLAKCQAKAREVMGFPTPDDPPSPERLKWVCCRAEGRCGGESKVLNTEDREKLAQILGQAQDWLVWRRNLYCHQLTGREHDPLDAHECPTEQPKKADPLAAVTARYKEAD